MLPRMNSDVPFTDPGAVAAYAEGTLLKVLSLGDRLLRLKDVLAECVLPIGMRTRAQTPQPSLLVPITERLNLARPRKSERCLVRKVGAKAVATCGSLRLHQP